MTTRTAIRVIPSITVAAVLAAGFAATPASATTEQGRAAVDQCRLRILKVRVLDLQHDQLGQDEVFAKIGNSVTTSRTYTIPQTRNTLGDGEERFSGTAQVALKVKVLGGPLTIATRTVTCQNSNPDFVFANGDARYKASVLVEVLP